MCWWPQRDDQESPAGQSPWAPDEEEVTLVTASYPQPPAGRGRFRDDDMEVRTQQFQEYPEPRSFEVQRTPATPQRRPNSSGKILELTPLWEQVLRYNRLPQNVERVKIFAELAMRLSDPEWEVRQHALRVLVDLIPVIPDANNDLDALMIPVVLTEVAYNLGHPAPAVRKSALDVLSVYVKHSSDPEFVLRSVVSQGLESPAANSNLTMSVLVCVPHLLEELHETLTKRDQIISHQSLVQVVTALSKKLVQTAFQQQAIEAMVKLRSFVGDNRFDHFLESYYPQIKRDFDVLCKVYEIRNSSNLGMSKIEEKGEKKVDNNENEEDEWSDNGPSLHPSSNVTSSTSTTERSRFEMSNEEMEKLESNSKLYTRAEMDSLDDKREVEGEEAEDYAHSDSDASVQNESTGTEDHSDKESAMTKKRREIDKAFGEKTQQEEGDPREEGRVVMETEIKFASDTAITMTILEEKETKSNLKKSTDSFSVDESSGKGERYLNDFVMHIDDGENGEKKTPRRVRFGGEVVKLRTPDSDVTIEIHEEVDGKETPIFKLVETKVEAKPVSETKIPKKPRKKKVDLSISGKESVLYRREDGRRPRSSHIPLPITPALSRPRPPWTKRLEVAEDEGSSIPTMDGGESLTSGSEGEPAPARAGFRDVRVAQEADEWRRLGFIDQIQLENLLRKDDWRAKVRALDKLTTSLQQPEVARFVSVSSQAGLSLLMFLLKTLSEDRSQRVVCSSLRAVRTLVQAIAVADLLHVLPVVVAGTVRHLGGGTVATKLEAVAAVKVVMKAVRVGPAVEVLLGDDCLHSKSSRLRENSLLCLMYALMTFPSSDIPVASVAQRVMSAAVSEPRRRVRQAILETLAALGQFLAPSVLRLDPADVPAPLGDDADSFTRALQTRLMRRVLPSVSAEGLILYGLQIPSSQDSHSSTQSRDSSKENSASFSMESNDTHGADVEWVLAGTGVLSSGSARSRSQLNHAQRSFTSPSSPQASGQAWDSDSMAVSGVSVNGSKESSYSDDSKASQDMSGEPRPNHPSHVNMRPDYAKMQNGIHEVGYGTPYHQDQGFPKITSNHAPRWSHSSDPLNQTWPLSHPGRLSSRKLAILEPLDHHYQYGLFKVYENETVAPLRPHVSVNHEAVSPLHPNVSINPSNLPPLEWKHQSRWGNEDRQRTPDTQRTNRWSRRQPIDERDRENGLKPVLARQSRYPTAHTKGTAPSVPPTTYPAQPQRFVSPVPSPVPSPITPLAPSPSSIVPAPSSQSLQVEDLSGDNTSEELRSRPSSELRLAEPSVSTDQVDTLTVQEERLSTPPPPATPPPPLAAAETEPETQSEELVDDKPVSGQTKFGKNTGKPRLRGKGGLREANSEAPASPKAPPFDNPKDALNRSLQQLEHPEWEVTIQGLQSLVRLSRHHTALLPPVLHQVVMALTKHVRNLRSQVARVACKAATYLFTSLGRGMENEMDELCAVLFNRTADTNKFLRADCNTALDAMVDHVSANKAVAIVVNKGAKHQNAVVRTAACRLLLRLCTRLGPERTLNLPRDTRDAILNTAARSLTEGSLDTRRLAKEMFVLLGRDSRLPTLLTQVVPASVMRSISKVLARLTDVDVAGG